MKSSFNASVIFLAGLVLSGTSLAQSRVDEALPSYEKTSGVSGNLSSVGSDTLANLMTLWAEEFKREYPNVNVQIQAAGSSTAPPALTENTSNLGPMSRLMKDKEVEAFEKRHGYKPTPVPVAIDALAETLGNESIASVPEEVGRKLAEALAPGGRLVIIDFRYDPDAEREFAPPLEQQVERDLEQRWTARDRVGQIERAPKLVDNVRRRSGSPSPLGDELSVSRRAPEIDQ
mgnify:CR=1 FL=1